MWGLIVGVVWTLGVAQILAKRRVVAVASVALIPARRGVAMGVAPAQRGVVVGVAPVQRGVVVGVVPRALVGSVILKRPNGEVGLSQESLGRL